MAIRKPFRRTYRPFLGEDGKIFRHKKYVCHPKFAISPLHNIRSFLFLQKDVQELFEYIEPADENLECYSHRIHHLLIRACIEIEANCKSILKENKYRKRGNLNMADYSKIENSHKLSEFEIKFPFWRNNERVVTPFKSWKISQTLPWYRAYNDTKHDSHRHFSSANFRNMLDAMAGLVALLSSQFVTEEFSLGPEYIITSRSPDNFEWAIGSLFNVKFPQNWPDEDRYDFDLDALIEKEDPFQEFQY